MFRNNLDENLFIIRNKSRLVVQGFNQEEGNNCDETFAHLARINAECMRFKIFQTDIKSVFLNG